MVYIKKRKSVATKRPYKRRKYTKRRTKRDPAHRSQKPRFVMYNRLLSHKIRTKLTYCDTKTLSPGTGMDNHEFRLNSLFDFDWSGVGHQASFADQWAALYSKYRVLAVSYAVTFSPIRAAQANNFASGGTAAGETHAVSDSSHHDQAHNSCIVFTEASDGQTYHFTEASDLNTIRECGDTQSRVNYRVTTSDPYKTYKIYKYWSIKDLVSDVRVFNEDTAVTSNPADSVFLAVGVMSKDGGVASDYRFDIKAQFWVEYSTPKDVDGS